MSRRLHTSEFHVCVGSLTEAVPFAPAAHGAGITLCVLDPLTGRLEQRYVAGGILSPNYLAANDEGPGLFAITCDMDAECHAHAFTRGADGALVATGVQPTGARVGCHVCVLPDGRVCATLYCDSSIALFPARGGTLGPRESLIGYSGRSIHATRQEESHAHQAVVSPDGRWLYVCDLGAESGLAKNTVVIYTSDNGYFLGEHGFYNKMWMYEESLHLPLLIRLPAGIPRVNDELVSMLDIAPTILDFAGVNVPSGIQGKSLRPLLDGNADGWRQAFYYHYYGVAGSLQPDNWIAFHEILGIRTATSKLVCYPAWKDGPFWEYFDLESDPLEMRNLYADPTRQETVADARQQLQALAVRYQDREAVALLDKIKP